MWWRGFKHQPYVPHAEWGSVQAQAGSVHQSGTRPLNLVSVYFVSACILGLHISKQDIFVFRQLRQDGRDLRVGDMLEHLSDQAQLSVRQGVRYDINTLKIHGVSSEPQAVFGN